MTIQIPIKLCLWDKTSQTLMVPRSIVPMVSLPLQFCVVGKKFDIQFFWDGERGVYKFDQIKYDKRERKSAMYESTMFTDLERIVLIVDLNK
jgi:hypothetical protein